MAATGIVDDVAKVFTKLFNTDANNIMRASTDFVAKADKGVLNYLGKNSDDIEKFITHDANYRGIGRDSNQMAKYVLDGKGFSDANNFKNIARAVNGDEGFAKVDKHLADFVKQNVDNKPPPPVAPSHKILDKNKFENMIDYKMWKESKKQIDAEKAFESKDYNHQVYKDIQAMGDNKNKKMSDFTKADYNAYRDYMINESKTRDTTITDMLGYHKIPQTATGIAGTMWLVNKLASDKGQQNNAQLYNQQQY